MSVKQFGKQSIRFSTPPIIRSCSSVVGKKEGEGPLGSLFDIVEEDAMFGGTDWEEAEAQLMKKAAELAIHKAGLKKESIRYLIGGDLLGQLVATSFGTEMLGIPLLGVYGACSTMGESLVLAAILTQSGCADHVLALTSSHFASAEKQFRFPLQYGVQRPKAATWTVTGSGGAVVSAHKTTATDSSGDTEMKNESKPAHTAQRKVKITGVAIGKIVDYGVKDSNNMGACMAPAAYDTIKQLLTDFGEDCSAYDMIITGDLGVVGSEILQDLMRQAGYDLRNRHMDCGVQIFENQEQGTDSGGSGCGCSAVVLGAYVLPKLLDGTWKKVLFAPTGALLSTVTFHEGKSVPGICHALVLEGEI